MRQVVRDAQIFVDPRLAEFDDSWEEAARRLGDLVKAHPQAAEHGVNVRLTTLQEWDDLFGLGAWIQSSGYYKNMVACCIAPDPPTVDFIFTQQAFRQKPETFVGKVFASFEMILGRYPDLKTQGSVVFTLR